MTESRSPRLKPRAASPRARSRTWSPYWRHVYVCQIPRSFSRIAGRAACCSALRRISFGRVFTIIALATFLPQIGPDHLGVASNLVGLSLGDLLAHVEDGHAIGDVHHHAHVVLDQDDGRAPLLVDVEDETRHVLLLFLIHAAHRLVEEEDLGIEGERPAQLHTLLEPIGERAGGPAPQ